MDKGEKIMGTEGNLYLMSEKFRRGGSEKEVEGITIIIDGVIEKSFDILKAKYGYKSNTEVVRDVIFEGINAMIRKDQGNP